jgi:hypothetical protein
MSKSFIGMLDDQDDRDLFCDAISDDFLTLSEEEQDNLFRWVCEEVNETMDREDMDERTITGELAEQQKQTLREMGWEI